MIYFLPKSNSPKKKPLPSVKYSFGDVVWAKFNRRPWWPCQVTNDPQIEVHTKMKGDCFCLSCDVIWWLLLWLQNLVYTHIPLPSTVLS